MAALLGSIVGFERERLSWAAGLRTHMLVCVGACLVMIVSAFGFAGILNMPHVVLDPSRMAAQVVSGIGFLGAGAILLRGEVVRGLTTAASLWTVAAIGLAVGGGLYMAAMWATIIVIIILAGIKPIEDIYKDKKQSCTLYLRAKRGYITLDILQQAMGDKTLRIKQFIVQPGEDAQEDTVTISLTRIRPKDVIEITSQLEKSSSVYEVRKK